MPGTLRWSWGLLLAWWSASVWAEISFQPGIAGGVNNVSIRTYVPVGTTVGDPQWGRRTYIRIDHPTGALQLDAGGSTQYVPTGVLQNWRVLSLTHVNDGLLDVISLEVRGAPLITGPANLTFTLTNVLVPELCYPMDCLWAVRVETEQVCRVGKGAFFCSAQQPTTAVIDVRGTGSNILLRIQISPTGRLQLNHFDGRWGVEGQAQAFPGCVLPGKPVEIRIIVLQTGFEVFACGSFVGFSPHYLPFYSFSGVASTNITCWEDVPIKTTTATPTGTATSTGSRTATQTRSRTPTGTATSSGTATATGTVIPTTTLSPTSTPTRTTTGTATSTLTASPTRTATSTTSATPTRTGTSTATPTATASETDTATRTATSTASPTATGTLTGSPTRTATLSGSATGTATPSATASITGSATQTATSTSTSTVIPTTTLTPTGSSTATRTRTGTPTATRTGTSTGTATFTLTVVPTATASQSVTATSTVTHTASVTRRRTVSNTPTATQTGTVVPTATPTASATPTRTFTATATRTSTATASPTVTATLTATPTRTSTATATPSQTVTRTATISATTTRTGTLTATTTRSPTRTATITATASPTATGTRTLTLSPSSTRTSTATATETDTSTRSATLTRSSTITATATGTRTRTRTGTPTTTATATATSTVVPTYTLTATQTATASATSTRTRTFTVTCTNTLTTIPTQTPTVSLTGTTTGTLTTSATQTSRWWMGLCIVDAGCPLIPLSWCSYAPTVSSNLPATILWHRNGGPLLVIRSNQTLSVDAASPVLVQIQVTLQVQHGVLSLVYVPDTVNATLGFGNRTLVLLGYQDRLNEALTQLLYTPDVDYGGADTLTVVVDDMDPRAGQRQLATYTVRITMTGFVVRLTSTVRGSITTLRTLVTEDLPPVSELWLTLPADFTLNRCGVGYDYCLSQVTVTTEDGLRNTLAVPQQATASNSVVKVVLSGNTTLRGNTSIAITNVLLPNHCLDTVFTLQAMLCTVDVFGAKACQQQGSWATGYTSALDRDGVPQSCSLCNACRQTPFGSWDCNHNGARFFMPLGVASTLNCPTASTFP